jgi:hypothetical protein
MEEKQAATAATPPPAPVEVTAEPVIPVVSEKRAAMILGAGFALIIADVAYAAVRRYQMCIGEEIGLPIDALSDEAFESLLNGVGNRMQMTGAPLEDLHASFVRFRRAHGFVAPGEESSNPDRPVHPDLIPWASLHQSQRRKFAVFAAVVDALNPGAKF